MKYLIVSDTHFDDKTSKEDYDILKQIENIIATEEVENYIHCGDVFDKRIPSKESIRLILDHFYSINKLGVKNIYIKLGNHDITNNEQYSLDFLGNIINLFNIKILKENEYIIDNIYVNHCEIREAQINYSNIIIKENSFKKIIEEFPECKLFLFGHIHKPQLLNENPFVLIPGSTNKISFNEYSEDKFVYIVESESPLLNHSILLKRIPLNIKQMLICDINFFNNKYEISINKGELNFNELLRDIIDNNEISYELNVNNMVTIYSHHIWDTNIYIIYKLLNKLINNHKSKINIFNYDFNNKNSITSLLTYLRKNLNYYTFNFTIKNINKINKEIIMNTSLNKNNHFENYLNKKTTNKLIKRYSKRLFNKYIYENN